MTLDELPFTTGDTPPTQNGARGRRCGRHQWQVRVLTTGGTVIPSASRTMGHVAILPDTRIECARCGKPKDEARARRGRSSARFGKDQERRIEHVYGPTKVGEFGDACDHLGRDWKWQSKATRAMPPLWLAVIDQPVYRASLPKLITDAMAHMEGIGDPRRPLVIRSYVRAGGLAEGRTRDWIFVYAADWTALHGNGAVLFGPGYVVMSGEAFLALHGRDAQ